MTATSGGSTTSTTGAGGSKVVLDQRGVLEGVADTAGGEGGISTGRTTRTRRRRRRRTCGWAVRGSTSPIPEEGGGGGGEGGGSGTRTFPPHGRGGDGGGSGGCETTMTLPALKIPDTIEKGDKFGSRHHHHESLAFTKWSSEMKVEEEELLLPVG